MPTRWIVDVTGRDGYRVAEHEAGRYTFATEVLPLEKAERALLKLRKRDEDQTHARRVENGRRLAARMHGTPTEEDDMTPLIDMIEDAFVEGRDSWCSDDSIDTEPLIFQLAKRGYDNDASQGMIEASITDALLEMRAKWGNSWSLLPGECAEAICRHLYVRTERS